MEKERKGKKLSQTFSLPASWSYKVNFSALIVPPHHNGLEK
jgi:hypothetical protein